MATYFNRSVEWEAYGAADVLLKILGDEPRYLLQRAAMFPTAALWSIRGGARMISAGGNLRGQMSGGGRLRSEQAVLVRAAENRSSFPDSGIGRECHL